MYQLCLDYVYSCWTTTGISAITNGALSITRGDGFLVMTFFQFQVIWTWSCRTWIGPVMVTCTARREKEEKSVKVKSFRTRPIQSNRWFYFYQASFLFSFLFLLCLIYFSLLRQSWNIISFVMNSLNVLITTWFNVQVSDVFYFYFILQE